MKAKEYAEQYKSDPGLETIAGIAKEFLHETSKLVKSRRCQSREAIFAVMDEQDRKWRALARLVPIILPEGYLIILEEALPTLLYEDYKYYKEKGI